MPRFDLRSLAPFGIGLAILAALYLIPTLAQNYQNTRSAEYAALQEYEKSKQVVPFDPSAQSPGADAKAYRDEWRSERDLRAQQDMASWAKWLLIATVVGIALLFATLWETRKAAQAAFEMVAEAKKTTIAANEALVHSKDASQRELRAYLSVEPRGINQLIKSDDGMGHVAVRNVGRLPAHNVVVYVNMRIADWREIEFTVGSDPLSMNRVIQPGAEMRQGSEDRIPIQEITTGAATERYIFVWGIVYYYDGYDRRRSTRFCHRYDTASYNRGDHWNRQSSQTRIVIEADKARYHIHGNDAD